MVSQPHCWRCVSIHRSEGTGQVTLYSLLHAVNHLRSTRFHVCHYTSIICFQNVCCSNICIGWHRCCCFPGGMCFEKLQPCLMYTIWLMWVSTLACMYGLNASSHLFLLFGRTLSSACMPTVSLVGVIEAKTGRRMLTLHLAFPT